MTSLEADRPHKPTDAPFLSFPWKLGLGVSCITGIALVALGILGTIHLQGGLLPNFLTLKPLSFSLIGGGSGLLLLTGGYAIWKRQPLETSINIPEPPKFSAPTVPVPSNPTNPSTAQADPPDTQDSQKKGEPPKLSLEELKKLEEEVNKKLLLKAKNLIDAINKSKDLKYKTKIEKFLNELNSLRTELKKKINQSDANGKSSLNNVIKQLEEVACDKLITFQTDQNTQTHLNQLDSQDVELMSMDNIITSLDVPNNQPILSPSMTNLAVTVTINQFPGLYQMGKNLLSGYYALFFMLQSITQSGFTNRKLFKILFNELLSLVLKKRSRDWIQQQETIPFKVENFHLNNLNKDDFIFLIENCSSLEALKNAPCYFVSLNDFQDKKNEDPDLKKILHPLNKSSDFTRVFPCYFIFQSDQHNFFFKSEKNNKDHYSLNCVHSLGYSILVEQLFKTKNFLNFLTCTKDWYIPNGSNLF